MRWAHEPSPQKRKKVDGRKSTPSEAELFATCGEPGARWNVPAHKVTLCYEMADEFVKLFKAYGDEPLTALSPAAGDRPGVPSAFKGFR